MQSIEFKSEEPPRAAKMLHVALLDGDGEAIVHEELLESSVPLRVQMLCLQAEQDVRDIPDASRRVYVGEAWPPESAEDAKS